MIDSSIILKRADLKITNFRKEVIEIIHSSDHAISSLDIEARLDACDRITLYRTLKSFEEKGLIHKINDADGNTMYAQCNHSCVDNQKHIHDAHLHFQCNSCNKLYCIENVKIPKIELPDYEIVSSNVTLNGKCKFCIEALNNQVK
jgi:Fur family transcriptional regulator, ferric uptake regulator